MRKRKISTQIRFGLALTTKKDKELYKKIVRENGPGPMAIFKLGLRVAAGLTTENTNEIHETRTETPESV